MYSITEQFVVWLGNLGFAASTYPPSTGTEFVTVERTGGTVTDMVDHPSMAVQTWAQDETRAEEMANTIRNAAVIGPLPYGVTRIEVNSGPYPFWDESTRMPRYQIAFDVTCQLTD